MLTLTSTLLWAELQACVRTYLDIHAAVKCQCSPEIVAVGGATGVCAYVP